MRLIHSLSLAALLLSPSMAGAAPARPTEIRLSEAEKEKILEAAAAAQREAPARQADETDVADAPARPIHGEVGFEVGTGGYRSAYGTTVIPLEDEGVAIISLRSTDFGKRRYPEPWWH